MPTPKRAPEKMAQPSGHGTVTRQAAAEKLFILAKLGEKKAELIKKLKGTPGAFFGRMFDNLPAFTAPDEKLLALATAMKEANPKDTAGDNPSIPAGFTYLGQFIDHDISLDLSSLSAAEGDPEMIRNFRTPGLDLDCVYGTGQGPHRFLFAREPGPRGLTDSAKLLLGKTQDSPDQTGTTNIPAAGKDNDLPRSPHGVALIGDHRNDENLLVAQTHVAFLKFHNKVVDREKAAGTPEGELFGKASREVRRHYQWMVLHDFVARLCGKDVVKAVLKDGRQFYKFKKEAFMPFEFSAAAYRLGHSMVREVYSHNRVFPQGPGGLAEGTLQLLFTFSGLSGAISGDLSAGGPTQPRVLPSNWIIDWRRFYDFGTAPGVPMNSSRRLDPFLTPQLHTLPGFPPGVPEANLAFRNLKRGVLLGLPSGQAVAKEMKKKIALTPLTPEEIASGPDGAVAKAQGFDKETPLWYYILKEAQVRGNNGERLGPVGARIVAEVFIGILQGDQDSFLNAANWKPTLPAKTPGTFLMTDLLRFVGDISPIDGVSTI